MARVPTFQCTFQLADDVSNRIHRPDDSQRHARRIGRGSHMVAGFAFGALAGVAVFTTGLMREHQRLRAELVAERARHRRELAEAETDEVTGLPNRAAWSRQVKTAAQVGRIRELALLDLDGFKRVNDRLGHHAGDTVLATVAARLQSSAPDALVGRAGGDELVIVPQRPAAWDIIAHEVSQPIAISGGDSPCVRVGVSIGIVPVETPTSLSLLLTAADRAMYVAKRRGGGIEWASNTPGCGTGVNTASWTTSPGSATDIETVAGEFNSTSWSVSEPTV